MGRNIAVCYPTVNITKPLQTPEEVEKWSMKQQTFRSMPLEPNMSKIRK
jgi:hypothetical protein